MIGIEQIDSSELNLVFKTMKQIEPESIKILRSELKSELKPIADEIANAMPNAIDLPSGFGHSGDTGYNKPKGKISFTPGANKRYATNLLSIRMDAGKQRGFYIAELAGSRNNFSDYNRGYTRNTSRGAITIKGFSTSSGRYLVDALQNIKPMKGKGGRFAYQLFRLYRPRVVEIATKILNDAFIKLSGKLQ